MHLSAGFSFRYGVVGEMFRIAELDVVDLYGVRWPRLLGITIPRGPRMI